MLSTTKKKRVINQAQINDKDTGSVPVQVSLLTKRIDELTSHLKKHNKDNHSRRGLVLMVGKRRRLLNYLEKSNKRGYNALIKKLGLKK
ncbi:MAG: 30S ribosomal protein S15 [Candidatus Harrisonbacteria bacterium CG10_big_fil_rev_8_21_14_0_10_38_8]|uniref:Small ribosomal subunit protein uS15 n=1 Tax=Candidatus Harrisonbacteria bacterium CG10_big_fil_rev_8_21_14_0_10_38_8 TaxID=1974582 RepID=A0A2M6WK98_9BACT|nr:MAG: 30S ribosomal protein S15 [Candidatus Harrisonbacteria bacterium CG10_big_fil_rev_8_21_14_0_10_38_8]